MSVYNSGASTTKGAQVDSKNLQSGQEYVFAFQAPKIAFVLLSPEHIASLLQGWVSLRQYVSTAEAGDLFAITGVQVDTESGEILVRGQVTAPPEVLESGINPWAIFALIAGIFAVVGIGVTSMGVYEVYQYATGQTPNDNPQLDPCTESGITASIKCLAHKSVWIGAGLGVGALLALVAVFVVIGRESRA